jgi:hypothetical protein
MGTAAFVYLSAFLAAVLDQSKKRKNLFLFLDWLGAVAKVFKYVLFFNYLNVGAKAFRHKKT